MLFRLILENFRNSRTQAALNAVAIALEVAILLTVAETTCKTPQHAYPVILFGRAAIATMAWMVLIAAFAYTGVNRYSQVRNRTQEFAILTMLGASWDFILELLIVETYLVALPGALVGVLFSFGIQWMMRFGLRDIFNVETIYQWWFLAGVIAAACFLLASLPAAWMARRRDLMKALAYE